MKRTNIHLTEQQLKILHSQSGYDGLPLAEHVRRAIDKYIEELKSDYKYKLESAKKSS